LPSAAEAGSSSTAEGYLLEASTAPDFTGLVHSSSTPGIGLSTLCVGGLYSNSTYYFRAGGINWSGAAWFSAAVSTLTHGPPRPVAPILTAVAASSVGASFEPLSQVEGYVLEASTDFYFLGMVVSSATFNPGLGSLAVSGLDENTTYFFRVGSIRDGATTFAEASPFSTSTLARAFPWAGVSEIYLTTAVVNWVPLPGPGFGSSNTCEGSLVEASLTAEFASVARSAEVSGPMANGLLLAGLEPSTTYYFRVGSRNWNSALHFVQAGWAATLGAPAPLLPELLSVGMSSASARWGPVSADGYVLEASTSSDFTGASLSSVSFVRSADALSVEGLDPNTTYYLRAGALWSHTTFFSAVSSEAATLALPVANAELGAVFFSSAAVRWVPRPQAGLQGSSNSAEGYCLEASTASDFPAGALSSATANAALSTLTVRGLLGDSTYYFRVGSLNWRSDKTYALAGSAFLPPLPAPLWPRVEAVFVSSIAVVFAPCGAEEYRVQASTAVDFTGAVLSSSAAGASLFRLSVQGLSPDATHYLRAGSAWGGETVFAAAGASVTLPAAPWAPEGGAFAMVGVSSLAVAWSSGSVAEGFNPPDARYLAELSVSSSFLPVDASTRTQALSAVLSGLSAQATYYARVRALGRLGEASGFSLLGSSTTRPLGVPSLDPVSGACGVSSISWRWSLVEGAGLYRILSSTDGTVFAELGSGATEWAELSLSTNMPYSRRLAAFAGTGASTSAALRVFTLAEAPGPAFFDEVCGSSLSVSWAPNTNPDGTQYLVDYWKAGASSATASVSSASLRISGLEFGATYFVSIRALNGDGRASGPSPAVSTATALAASVTVSVDPGSPLSVEFLPADGPVRMDLPARSFSEGLDLTLSSLGAFPPSGGGLTGVGSGVEVRVSKSLPLQREVSLSVSYPASKAAGLDESLFILARYDEVRGAWVPLPSSADASSRRVLGKTSHLSVFQIVQGSPSGSVASARAFPNPLRPSQGHGSMTFADLPSFARLRIYTLAGELVKDVSANAAGIASWDGTNSAGNDAASGVYFVLAQSGGERRVFKVAVQR
jgi:hypothetical protein